MQFLREKLDSCLRVLNNGQTNQIANINWLNDFCAEFLNFSNCMQKFIGTQKENDFLEIICLCLTQIIICIRQLECTIQTEITSGARIQASHHHFIDRITVCLKRLCASLEKGAAEGNSVEGVSFVTLLDNLLDSLSDFTTYNENITSSASFIDSPEELLVLSKQIKIQIDLLLGHTLSFANVALQQDKKALSALCQKVMRDCSAFQNECQNNSEANHCNLKLKAMSLEQALHQLEEYVNDTLLRLVFTCFLDFQKISVDKIRNILRTGSDSTADEFIADFDVNLDRATQIGIFSIAFAPSLKIKTTVRSCLASFEYLDTSLIPSLQTNALDLHSELLEQHFKEEVSKFKTALQEIIDSHAFVGCYLQILTSGINAAEKEFDKLQLEDLLQMGFFILEHFNLDVNQKALLENGRENLKDCMRILRECKAILMCAAQVDTNRIIKRFKILRSILRKLHSSIAIDHNGAATSKEHNKDCILEETYNIEGDLDNVSHLMASPSGSILYDRNKSKPTNKTNSEYLKAKACLRRRESLRTTMFKRQNFAENMKLENTISSQTASLEISNILDQLSCLTSTFARSLQVK